MYLERPNDQTIDRYAGPYERWVFSDELGRPFAFPTIAGQDSGYHTALLEGAQIPPDRPGVTTRLPPIWNPNNQIRSVTPFAFFDSTVRPTAAVQTQLQDASLSKMLGSLRDSTYRTRSVIEPRFRVNFPIDPRAWTADYLVGEAPDNWSAPATPPTAIVAVIDDGLPFAHQAFLDGSGMTRVSHCWLQSGLAQTRAHVPFGRELTNTEIDDWRSAVGSNDAEIYRRAGAVDTALPELGNNLLRHATHGAHVMGIAAGNAPVFDAAPLGDDIQIIAVQLPNTIAWDTSGFGKEMYMLSALHYIFERASRIAAHYDVDELPLVVNFSYGWAASRHDGESEMELAIQELLQARQDLQPKTALCMPSGNNFGSRMHGVIANRDFTGAPETAKIGWQLLPDDLTSSYLELWFPRDLDPTGYTVKLTPPNGIQLDQVALLEVSADPANASNPGDPRRFIEIEYNGENIGQLSADQHRGSRWRVLVALVPTTFTRGQTRKTPPGLWTLSVHRDGQAAPLATDQELQIWVQRDDDPSDLKSHGRQSRLVSLGPRGAQRHPLQHYATDLGQVRGFGAINGVASATATTRVAGYVQQTGRACRFSAAGGLRQADDGTVSIWGQHNDVSAVADQSPMRPGIPSIGVTSGARARLVGTSGACPSAARMMVLNAAAGRPLMDGFTARPPLNPVEDPDDRVAFQYKQQIGETIIPPILKSG